MSETLEVTQAPAGLYDVTVDVLGDPKGQPRARAFHRKGLGVRMYDPGTAEGYKSQIAMALKPVLPTFPIAGPVELHMCHRFQRPKGHFNSKGLVKSSASVNHTQKFDIDNLVKAGADAISQIGVWADDDQVILLKATKRWCKAGERPGCKIRIRELEPQVYCDFDI